MKKTIIAIDGPAGAGKSTIAKLLSEKTSIPYVDTGAMYRALTLKCLQNNVDIDNEKEVAKLAENTEIIFKDKSIYLDGKTVDAEIRKIDVSSRVSDVAKIKEVRLIMVDLQRKIGEHSSLILDGRDIGTQVFPNADFKFFLTADVMERAKRRYKEMVEKGDDVNLEDIVKDIENRDRIDSTRAFAPLKKADDAIEVDTTKMSIEEVADCLYRTIEGR